MRHVWIEATGQLVSIDDGKPADFCAVYQNGTVATGPEPLPKYAPEQPAAERIAVQQERITTLEGMLAENKRVLRLAMDTVARLQWQPITLENLPKVGDEIYAHSIFQYMMWDTVSAVSKDKEGWGYADFEMNGWTHFRPINAPLIAARTVPPAPQDTEKDAG